VTTSHTRGTRWGERTLAQRRAAAEYARRVRPLVAVWADTLRDIIEESILNLAPDISRLLGLRRWLDQVEVPPDGEYAHAALIDALEQTLVACGAILTRQRRAMIDRARDDALISFNAFEIEIVYLAGVENSAPAPA
jgi:hypothetical protein